MKTSDFHYPVIRFYKEVFSVISSEDQFGTCNLLAFKKGTLIGCLLVDSDGLACRIQSVKKLGLKGLCGGFDIIFLNPMLKIESIIDDTSFTMTVEDLRSRVLHAFNSWDGYESRGDFDEMKYGVMNGKSVADIIGAVI